MKVLLDTHTLLWWVTDDPQLSHTARESIEHEDVLVSVVSLWEIEIKRALGRIEGEVAEIIDEVTRTEGFAWLDVRPGHVLSLGELAPHHRDPFDRMLVAQARSEGAILLSRDEAIHQYDLDVRW